MSLKLILTERFVSCAEAFYDPDAVEAKREAISIATVAGVAKVTLSPA